jgi:IclR family pca regulon transcriptional regulator
MLRDIPLVAMTDRTVVDREEFRKVLEKVGAQGWALVDQEMEKGLMSVAVPLYDSKGGLVGAINASVPTVRTDRAEMIGAVLPKLQETVGHISRALSR